MFNLRSMMPKLRPTHAIGIILLSVVIGVAFVITGIRQGTFSESYAQVLVGIFGVFATIALALGVYFQAVQNKNMVEAYQETIDIQESQVNELAGQASLQEGLMEIQKRQSTIMERQSEIMGAEHKPNIQVNEWEILENQLHFWLSNIGNGIATDLGVDIYVEPIEDPEEYGTPDRRYESFPTHIERMGTSRDPSYDHVLESGEHDTKFSGPIMMPDGLNMDDLDDFYGARRNFESWWEDLDADRFSAMLVDIRLIYNDITESEYAIPITTVQKPIDNVLSFEELLDEDRLPTTHYNPKFLDGDSNWGQYSQS